MPRGATRHHRSGFTFMELLVVVCILLAMTAAVTPLFAGSLTEAQENRLVRDLIATLRYAGEMAIVEEVEFRVYIDDENGRYWVARRQEGEKGPQFVRLPNREGEDQFLPAEMKFDRVRALRERVDRDRVYYIAFYPGGACTVASLRLERRNGDTIDIDLKGGLGEIVMEEKR